MNTQLRNFNSSTQVICKNWIKPFLPIWSSFNCFDHRRSWLIPLAPNPPDNLCMAAGLIFATGTSCKTVYSLNVDVSIKWWIGFPLTLNLDWLTPFLVAGLTFTHKFVLPDLQNLHSWHSAVLGSNNKIVLQKLQKIFACCCVKQNSTKKS
jgi:hypothetical protein